MLKSYRKPLLVILPLLLAACATNQNYMLALRSWQGASINELVRVWGYPTKRGKAPDGNVLYIYHSQDKGRNPIYRTGGTTTITQKKHHEVKVTTTSPVYQGGGTYDYECTTWFEVNKKNIIVNTSARGNNCVGTDDFLKTHRYQYQ